MVKRKKAVWYFDVVSPFAYLHFARFDELPKEFEIEFRPILLAALLTKWEHRGPAEIPGKRRYTYRWCQWWAGSRGVPFRFPLEHPFNPLPWLRLIVASGSTREVVQAVLEYVWRGGDPRNMQALFRLAERFGLAEAALGSQEVKDQLRRHTDEAIARGVFGVPTLVVGDELFWGSDSVEFFNAWHRDPGLLQSAEMKRLEQLPYGVIRRP